MVLGILVLILVLSIHVGRPFWRNDSFPRDLFIYHFLLLIARMPYGDIIFKNDLEAVFNPLSTPLQRS